MLERPNRRGGHVWVGKFTVKGQGRAVMRTIGPVKSKLAPDGLTRGRAEAALQAMIDEAKINPQRTKASKTLQDAGDALLSIKRAEGRKPKTLEAIASAVRVHIVPFFGAVAVSKITAERVQQFRDALVQGKGLAVKSVANTMGVLHGLFAYAIDQEWATHNPVKKVPKPRSNAPVDVSYLTPKEVEALLRAVPDTQLGRVDRVMYLMAVKPGPAHESLVKVGEEIHNRYGVEGWRINIRYAELRLCVAVIWRDWQMVEEVRAVSQSRAEPEYDWVREVERRCAALLEKVDTEGFEAAEAALAARRPAVLELLT